MKFKRKLMVCMATEPLWGEETGTVNLVVSTIKERNNINIKIAAYKVLGKCEQAAKLTLENNDFQTDLGKLQRRDTRPKNKLVMITQTRILSEKEFCLNISGVLVTPPTPPPSPKQPKSKPLTQPSTGLPLEYLVFCPRRLSVGSK